MILVVMRYWWCVAMCIYVNAAFPPLFYFCDVPLLCSVFGGGVDVFPNQKHYSEPTGWYFSPC